MIVTREYNIMPLPEIPLSIHVGLLILMPDTLLYLYLTSLPKRFVLNQATLN